MEKMKKLLAALITAAMTASVMPVMAEEPISVFVDGAELQLEVPPTVENGRTLVPMRAIFEALGAEVGWDNDSRTATAIKDGVNISITIDEAQMIKNGEVIPLDVPARIVNSRTLVPVRAVSEGLDADVEWNGQLQRVIVTTAAGAITPDFDLTDEDMALLSSRYDSIRTIFEREILYQAFNSDQATFSAAIANRLPELLDAPSSAWYAAVLANILYVQSVSDTKYDFGEYIAKYLSGTLTEKELDALWDRCKTIADKAGLTPENFFEVSFEELQNGRNTLLITFFDAPASMSKYISLSADSRGAIREINGIVDDSGLRLWEVTSEGLVGLSGQSYPANALEKTYFLSSLGRILNNGQVMNYI